jgi:hypothetical protein
LIYHTEEDKAKENEEELNEYFNLLNSSQINTTNYNIDNSQTTK